MREKSNPAFRNISYDEQYDDSTEQASYGGIGLKTALCFLLTVISALSLLFMPANLIMGVLIASAVVSLVTRFAGVMSEKAAKICCILFSISEGFLLGSISIVCEVYIPGLVSAAVVSTLTVFGVSLLFFATGLVRASNKLRKFLLISLSSIMVVSIIGLIASLLGFFQLSEFLYGDGVFALFLAGFIIILCSIMLIFNFDDAANLVENGAPKRTEWMAVMGLVISVLYLYYQILRFLILVAAHNRD